MPEQLVENQFIAQNAARYGNERAITVYAQIVDGPSGQFLPGFGFAIDVNTHIKLTDQADVSTGCFKAEGFPDQVHINECISDNLFGLRIHRTHSWPRGCQRYVVFFE
jgi:hypothetical protein